MPELNEAEREFVRIITTLFGFLLRYYGCHVEVSTPVRGDLIVLVANANVGLEFTLTDEKHVMILVLELRQGRPPRYFARDMTEALRGFALEDYLRSVEPGWRPEPLTYPTSSAHVERVLRAYSDLLARHAAQLMTGDADVVARMRDRMRRPTIDAYLALWSRFVERVRVGFDGPITDYIRGITARAQLAAVLNAWEGDRQDDPVAEIARLDRTFEEATEPLMWGAGRNAILPIPTAKRWWRRPKFLVSRLRDYLERNTK